MTAPFRVVAVSGSLHEPSKTTAFVRAISAAVAERAEVEAQLIELTRIGPGLAGAPSSAINCRGRSRRSCRRSSPPIC